MTLSGTVDTPFDVDMQMITAIAEDHIVTLSYPTGSTAGQIVTFNGASVYTYTSATWNVGQQVNITVHTQGAYSIPYIVGSPYTNRTKRGVITVSATEPVIVQGQFNIESTAYGSNSLWKIGSIPGLTYPCTIKVLKGAGYQADLKLYMLQEDYAPALFGPTNSFNIAGAQERTANYRNIGSNKLVSIYLQHNSLVLTNPSTAGDDFLLTITCTGGTGTNVGVPIRINRAKLLNHPQGAGAGPGYRATTFVGIPYTDNQPIGGDTLTLTYENLTVTGNSITYSYVAAAGVTFNSPTPIPTFSGTTMDLPSGGLVNRGDAGDKNIVWFWSGQVNIASPAGASHGTSSFYLPRFRKNSA